MVASKMGCDAKTCCKSKPLEPLCLGPWDDVKCGRGVSPFPKGKRGNSKKECCGTDKQCGVAFKDGKALATCP